MTRHIRTITLGTSLMLLATPVAAQDGGDALTEEQVRSFFDSMEQEAMQAVQAGDFQRLIEWTGNHLTDDATFSLTNEVYRGDRRMGFSAVTLTRQDIMDVSRMAAGMLSGMSGKTVEDYSLQIEITGFTPVGTDAATVTASFTESGTLSLPSNGAAASQDSDENLQTGSVQRETQQQTSDQAGTAAGGEAKSLKLSATAECTHLVRRGESGEEVLMGLSTCQATTRF